MNREKFMQGKPFVIKGISRDYQYSESLWGGELIEKRESQTVRIEIERITQDYFIADVPIHLYYFKSNKIYFKNCELK